MSRTIIRIPSGSRVFLLEDSEERIKWFFDRLKPGSVTTTFVTLAKDANSATHALAKSEPFDIMFLDHDLSIVGATVEQFEHNNGTYVAKSIAESGFIAKSTIIHSWNPDGAANMAKILGNQALVMPFGRFDIEVY